MLKENVKIENQEVSTYLKEDIVDNQYTNFGNFDDVPHKRTYLHLLGDFKRQLLVCKKLETYVIQHYPTYYKKLEALLEIPAIASQISYNYTTETNKLLITQFTKALQDESAYATHSKHTHLLARDMYMTGKLETFYDFLMADINFILKLLPGFTINKEENLLTIQEFDGNHISEEMMLLDEIIFNELSTAQRWETFTQKALNYVSDDFPEAEKEGFIETLCQRIAHLITLKVVVALSTKFNVVTTKEEVLQI